MSMETFKAFVRQRPMLNEHVLKGEVTWQKFYEMYEMYGENSSVWEKFLNVGNNVNQNTFSFKDMFSSFKNMDMNELQKGISSVQKGLEYVKDLFLEKGKDTTIKKPYEPRPMYKYFDD